MNGDKVSLLIPWNSASVWYHTACKLKEALELDAMCEFSSKDFWCKVPSADEWEKVRCICKLVESAEATANIFLRNLDELRAILFQESISSDSFTGKWPRKCHGYLL